jgi:hypothetical protein
MMAMLEEAEASPEVSAGRLSQRDRQLGYRLFDAIARWPEWTHRRVEYVFLEDPVTIRRRVSFDFTVPDTFVPVSVHKGEPLHFIPFAFLTKTPLINFDLRDENGGAIPLLTKRRNGRLATATLVALAESVVSQHVSEKHGNQIPRDLEIDLWKIAQGDPASAEETWRGLGRPQNPDEASSAWRVDLVQNGSFMLLANDLARKFIAITPLRCHVGERRIVKFSYEHRHPDPILKVGRKIRSVWGVWLKVAGAGEMSGEAESAPTVPFRRWVARLIGWAPRVVSIDIPSLGHTPTYHLEIEAPEGLNTTRAVLQPQGQGSGPLPDVRRETLQRAHLYLSDQPYASRGAALVDLRPTSPTIVRGGTLAAGLTSVLLFVLAAQWSSIELRLGSLASLLLVVPGGLAAYVARDQEPKVTTHVLFGLRVLALASALLTFAAAAALVLGRTCVDRAAAGGAGTVCKPWHDAGIFLWIMFAISALFLVTWLVVWTRVRYPPEQKDGAPIGGR